MGKRIPNLAQSQSALRVSNRVGRGARGVLPPGCSGTPAGSGLAVAVPFQQLANGTTPMASCRWRPPKGEPGRATHAPYNRRHRHDRHSRLLSHPCTECSAAIQGAPAAAKKPEPPPEDRLCLLARLLAHHPSRQISHPKPSSPSRVGTARHFVSWWRRHSCGPPPPVKGSSLCRGHHIEVARSARAVPDEEISAREGLTESRSRTMARQQRRSVRGEAQSYRPRSGECPHRD
jgi:hypothetical protein